MVSILPGWGKLGKASVAEAYRDDKGMRDEVCARALWGGMWVRSLEPFSSPWQEAGLYLASVLLRSIQSDDEFCAAVANLSYGIEFRGTEMWLHVIQDKCLLGSFCAWAAWASVGPILNKVERRSFLQLQPADIFTADSIRLYVNRYSQNMMRKLRACVWCIRHGFQLDFCFLLAMHHGSVAHLLWTLFPDLSNGCRNRWYFELLWVLAQDMTHCGHVKLSSKLLLKRGA